MIDEFKYFNKHERRLLNKLYRAQIAMSSLALAKSLNMHWTTVEENLEKLAERDWVIKREVGNKTMWRFNTQKYEETKDEG